MKYNQQLTQLVISNIENHERAKLVLDEVNQVLLARIAKEVQASLSTLPHTLDEESHFKFYDEGYIDFGFASWLEEEQRLGYFSIEASETADEADHEWLTHVCGLVDSSNCLLLRFYPHYRTLGLKAVVFKSRFKEAFLHSQLPEQGYKLSADGYAIEYPFKLNHQDILQGYPHDLEQAMVPVTNTMLAFEHALPEFEKVLATLKEKA
ncbi:hypothetical protein A3K86_19580 [Photobacterium jeanii]|uniref:Uncharacterized protein n=1 Tax=Photobacterium jeanii TaxID=858640 RepID=A0A178K2I7_9GAMM|nr:hypothetical protein [Photobacterium jeanii]OAN11165.1 hypothetical protein A3K86_19580 [Photobacterium jeanii]PST90684.1 hypothetical protein C9I91_08680 [Photobacterium jeanii]